MLLPGIGCLILFFSACEKNNTDLASKCFNIKILDELCGTAVVQILDSAYFEYGVNGYVLNGVTYDHVFTTSFSCQELGKYQTFAAGYHGLALKVQLTTSPTPSNCVRCAAVVPNAPNRYQHVKVAENCSE